MSRIITAAIILFFMFSISYSQETETTKKDEASPAAGAEVISSEGNVYREITLMDFENIEFKESDIIFQKSRDEVYKVTIRDEAPAPIPGSKKYLGVKLRGSRSNAIQIKFPADKQPVINDYCQSISMWVYGKRFSGTLSLFIMDAEGNTHKLSFGKLNFHGWYKLTKILTPEIVQNEKFLERKSSMKILSILYVPGTWYKFGTNVIDPVWQSFYVDDITAKVRDKYKDIQDDDW